jgi:hypothetical protein
VEPSYQRFADADGHGLGTHALNWLTEYLFTEFPDIRRDSYPARLG